MRSSSRTKLTIGVSGASMHTKSVRAMMKQIREEGAHAVFLDRHVSHLARAAGVAIERIDALVVMGNDLDIDPKLYIDRYPPDSPKRCIHPQTRSEHSTPKGLARARYEDAILRKALAYGMPVLGVCGGMQRLNVLCGGTLHQHLPDLVGCDKHRQHKQGIAPHIPVVPVIIKDGTMLAKIAGHITMGFTQGHSPLQPKVIMENSMHHQAVDRIAPSLHVCAVTDTVRLKSGRMGYLAEAIETDPEGKLAGQFILGVQWHPEFGASSLGQKIVQHMIVAAQEFVRMRARRTAKYRLQFMLVQSIYYNG